MIIIEHSRALPAVIVAAGFAVLARGLRAVSDGGALVGAVIAFLLMNAAGLGGFIPLVVVFLLTLLATRWRDERKRSLGVAERKKGRKSSQVLANLGTAGLCAIAAAAFRQQFHLLMVGSMAALAEAAADTVSSEVGQAVGTRPRMILSFDPAPVGTNGAISIEGTLAGCIASSIVAWTGSFFGVVAWGWSPVVTLAGIAGMFFDSILGATFENRGKIGNDTVNFVSTVFAADLALLAALVVGNVRI